MENIDWLNKRFYRSIDNIHLWNENPRLNPDEKHITIWLMDSMERIYSMTHRKEWDDVVRSFADYDVYYLSGYVKAFQIHGDGESDLLY